MREIQPQFNPGGIEKQFGRSRTQLARVNKEISTSQPLSRPESTNQATMLDHLPNGTTEVHQTSQATSKHHFGRQIQKIGREKCLLREIDEGSSIRPTAMHRMADELKTSRRREHRWKLILWSPKNTKEERKETIEQIKMAKGITSRSHWRAHERSPNPHYNEFLTIQEMADGVKFGRSRASKMADNPNHGIYRGHRLKSPPSSIHIASKEENPDWNEQNWRSRRKTFPEPI
ncbi:unnamed protein product [Microthlaspi erraticum]|uniref:Uncharacterized protein n=1 Tax=Microthlaspi erraticum TaxID=1685480 RepID=A0A6D2JBF0_9BRAS|nr:unnamed protein product [Microthlaspi erraticum]